jgi:hypothetical protein
MKCYYAQTMKERPPSNLHLTWGKLDIMQEI